MTVQYARLDGSRTGNARMCTSFGACTVSNRSSKRRRSAATLGGVRDTPGGDVTDNGSPLDSVTIHDAFLTQRKRGQEPSGRLRHPSYLRLA
jgi:hypothetical protein